MIYTVPRTSADTPHIRDNVDPDEDPFDYGGVIVKKPWGYEYLVFENDHVAIWMLHIIRTRKTSMHCHPRKRTGLILLSGGAAFHHLGGSIELSAHDAVNIEAGAFHCTEAASPVPISPVSENGIWVMEIEAPPLKKDLCRLKDAYGRAGASYEGASNMVFEPKETLKLEAPDHGGLERWKYQDLTFSMRCGSLDLEQRPPSSEALTAIVGLPGDGLESLPEAAPAVGELLRWDDFLVRLGDHDLSGITLMTIEKENKRMKLTDYLADRLADLGVDTIFAVSGGGAMHLVDSFGSRSGIEYVATHHEQAAAMAAEGYARIKGGLGAALVTSGPGGTNAITGVCGAWVDSIPTIFFSGQVTQDTLIGDTGLRQFGIQEINIIDLVRPITKYAVTVTDPESIRYHLDKALHLATSGRPGPVWIDIPLDVQGRVIDPGKQTPFQPAQEVEPPARLTGTALQQRADAALEMLSNAKRPVMICGYGVRLAGCEAALQQLVRRLGLPVVSSWTSSDLFASDDPNYVGRSGIMGERAGNFAVQNADLILVLGSRLSIPQVGYNYKLFAREAKKIMVDIDAAELEKPSLSLDLAIEAHLGDFMASLQVVMDHRDQSSLEIEPWRQRCREWKQRYPVALPEYRNNKDRINSFYFVDQLSRRLGPEARVVTDMGTSFTCTMQTFQTKLGQRLFTSSGLASMGYGLPGVIGACYGGGRAKTILITGDGGLQMNLQELQTVVHNRLPLLIFVLNNGGYLTIKLMQQNHFGRYVGSNPESGVSFPDMVKLSEALGLEALRLTSQEELDRKLDHILDHPGPLVVEIMMPEEQPLIPRVSSMKLPDGTVVSKPMEDLYPFLEREEFMANMEVKPVEILNKKP